MARFTFRAATTADLGTIADNLVAGFMTYRSWADVRWKPPDRLEMLTGLVQRFPRDGSWAVIAFEGREPVGHAAARPEHAGDVRPLGGLARLAHLFVREPYWGSGVAHELHAHIVDGMAQRGFEGARLWTPAGQARARAFYARHGWRPTGASDPSNELGVELLEYELEPLSLTPPTPPTPPERRSLPARRGSAPA
jgi:GNAT superfamily N-acetyltransferase